MRTRSRSPPRLIRGFIRIVWLLKPTNPSAGAGAAAQLPTQCLLPCIELSSRFACWADRAAEVAPAAMVLIDSAPRPQCGRGLEIRVGLGEIVRYEIGDGVFERGERRVEAKLAQPAHPRLGEILVIRADR